MKILLISRALAVGAYQRKAELMAECGIELSVIVPRSWKENGRRRPAESLHTAGYKLIPSPVAQSGSFHLHRYPKIARLIEEIPPDLIHIDEEAYNLASYLILRVARRKGIPCLFFTWQNLDRRYPPPFSWMEQAVYEGVAGAIVGNRDAADVLRRKGYSGPLWELPQFGVDPAIFLPPEPDPRFDTDRDPTLRVGYAGRLIHAKGVDVLIRALAQLDPTSHPWSLEIVGEGDAQKGLEALVERLGVCEQVAFCGWHASDEMPAFYQRIDVLALPSRTTRSWAEQFGRVLIEAMASGAVCLGSDSGEIPNVIGPAGRIAAEDDVNAWQQALTDLASKPDERKRLSTASIHRARTNYSMQYIAQRTVEIYREVLNP